MRFGVTLPNMGVGEDPRTVVDLAVQAEEAGWDGVFIWDAPFGGTEYGDEVQIIHDAWVTLSAVALRTENVMLGTMITPLPWRTPWLVARQAATLQLLSRGRVVLAVGLGYPPPDGTYFYDVEDRKTRAQMLDEGLDMLERLWSGETFSYEGRHYRARNARLLPAPEPRVPIWVVGAWHRDPKAWPRRRSLRRAMRWDGVLPNVFDSSGVTFDVTREDIASMSDWIRSEHSEAIDVICEGGGEKEDVNTDAETAGAWRDAGATWWLEAVWWSMYRHPGDPEPMRERIRAGPPVL